MVGKISKGFGSIPKPVGKISKGFGSIPKPRGGILGGKMKLMKPSGKLPKLGYNMKRPGVMLKPMSMKKPKMGRL